MRSISITLLGILLTLVSFSQVSYDTTYSRQWNSTTKSWENYDRIISTYNDGLITAELMQISEGEAWVNYNLRVYNYNNGLVIEEFEQYWNDLKNKWEDNYRKLYSYDSDNKVTMITHQNIFQGNYVNSSREVYKYSEDGKLVEKIIQKYEEAWSNFLRYQYYYNANELIMDENLAYWNGEVWNAPQFNYSYSYNSKGQLTEKTKVEFKGSKSKNLTKEEYSYSDNGRIEEHTVSTWNGGRNRWIDRNREIFSNDLNGYVLSMLGQSHKNKEWINYFFTEFSGNQELYAGLDITGGMSFAVTPKDYGKTATIEFTNPYNELFFVQVLDEQGQLIGSSTTDGKEISIDARYLNKGLYFVELQGSNLYSGKFSIE